MGRLSSPRPTSPGTDQNSSRASVVDAWKCCLRKRTLPLVKYLATACVGMMFIFFISQSSSSVIDLVSSSRHDASRRMSMEKPKATIEEIRTIHQDRWKAVEGVCRRNGITPNNTIIQRGLLSHIYVDDKYKFLYCTVPKVACTNFKRILLILSGRVNASSPTQLEASDVHKQLGHKLNTLDQFPINEIKRRLRTYYKFMFVRDPLERILSAYINKFTLKYNTYFHKRYGTNIIKAFRDKPTLQSLEKGDDVTFSEFVEYLLEPSESQPLNEHWRHYYKLCSPCIVQYDTIGKYETMGQDIDYVLGKIGVKHLIQFPNGTAGNSKGSTSSRVNTYYKNISSEQVHRLWEMYSVDYAMFKYPYPDVRSEGTQ